MERTWYTVAEASKILGVSKYIVREKLSTKEIKGNKIGRECRIFKTSINNLLGIENNQDEKEIYIKQLEERIKYLALQNEAFKSIAKSLIEVMDIE